MDKIRLTILKTKPSPFKKEWLRDFANMLETVRSQFCSLMEQNLQKRFFKISSLF
jgi:hypothetical protein